MSPRAIRIALIVSLVINVFVVGGVIGAAVIRARAADPLALVGRSTRLREAADRLPDAERRALRQSLRTASGRAATVIGEARAARRDAAQLLTAPTFDRTATAAAFARARRADFAIRTEIETGLLDFAAGLPAADRAGIAKALSKATRPPRDGGGRHRRRRDRNDTDDAAQP